jgi:septal ring factor EnvC (AmiA/AmiB activator)
METSTAYSEKQVARFAAALAGVADTADCALDEQLEQLQRQYAAASRSADRAKFEHSLLAKADDIAPELLRQAEKQRDAAQRRCERLLSAIETLEDRLERE